MGTNHPQINNDGSIKFGQLNLGKCKAATNNLIKYITDSNIDICMIQEPHTRGMTVAGFPRALKVIARRVDQPRSAIVISNPNFSNVLLSNVSCELVTVAEIVSNIGAIYAISVYLPPTKNDYGEDELFRRLENAIDQVPDNAKLIIGGDFNAKSPVWGSATEDRRGTRLTEVLERTGLTVLNRGSRPTFVNHRGSSRIDITATNGRMFPDISDWTVTDEETLTEHALVTWTSSVDNPRDAISSRNRRFCNKKADWSKFEEEFLARVGVLNAKIAQTESPEETEKTATSLNVAIIQACEASMPRQKQFSRSVPWWSAELTRLRTRARRLRRRFQRSDLNQREERRQEYREASAEYKTAIETARANKWRDFCTENAEKDPWGIAYRVLRGKSRGGCDGPSCVKTEDGTYTRSAKETAAHLLRTFFPIDDNQDDDAVQTAIRRTWQEEGGGEDGPNVTEREVQRALARMNPNKAPGHDGITSDAVLRAFLTAPGVFVDIFNLCLKFGTFPKCWKIQTVKFIPKPRKDDPTDPRNFRPISLLPTVGKVLDKIVTSRTEYAVYQSGGFNDKQFGFSPGKSTVSAIETVIAEVKEARARSDYCAVVSLDISGAFDHAWWPLITWELERRDFPRNWLRLIKNYFSDRTAQVLLPDSSVVRDVTRGCPQGSCSGPTFWKLLYEGIFRERLPEGCSIYGFADDTALVVRGRQYNVLKARANEALETLRKWANSAKLKFNAAKTDAVFFGKRPTQPRPTFKLGEERVYCKDTIRYLGVLIDYRLSWKQHIAAASAKGKQVAHRIGASARLTWGFKGEALKKVYEGAIQPAILYAAPVWAEGCKVKQKQQMLSAQRVLTVKAATAYSTVSTEAALVISGIPPIDLIAEQMAEERSAVHRQNEDTLRELQLEGRVVERRVEAFTLAHPSDRGIKCLMEVDDAIETKCYTDGSRMEEGRAGAAFVIYNGDREIHHEKIKLADDSTIFQCEMLAIRSSIAYITANIANYPRVAIISDSRSVLQALETMESPTELQAEVWRAYRALSARMRLSLHWTKAHVGTPGNERADELAKEAAISEEEAGFDQVPRSLIKRKVRDRTTQRWEARWENATTGRLTAKFVPSLEVRLKEINGTLDRFVVQLMTGHGNFKSYLLGIGKQEDDTCECGGTDEAEHVLLECPTEEQHRGIADRELVKHGLRWPTSMAEVTSLCREKEWWTALRGFASAVNRLKGTRERR